MVEEGKSTSDKPKPRDAREWTHNDALMLQLEGQRIENPLLYTKIVYPHHEWDNIPPVIPKFIIQLEKYMQGITENLTEASKLETVSSIRTYAEKEVSEIDKRLKGLDLFRRLLKNEL